MTIIYTVTEQRFNESCPDDWHGLLTTREPDKAFALVKDLQRSQIENRGHPHNTDWFVQAEEV